MTVHTIDDLTSRDLLDAGGKKPAKLAVIGHPVKHSASPRMHQPALDEAGIDARYVAIDIEPGQVREAFARMRALGFVGTNVTVPHKFDALAACDEIDEAAKMLGAVNTVRFDEDAIRGSNTDGYGFEQAVREALGFELKDRAILIAGAGGGAGGAIAAHCVLAGARKLVLANRTVSKIEELAARLQGGATEVQIRALDDASLAGLAHDCDLLVNTSSLGLKDGDPSPLDPACFRSGQAVFDTIYQPPLTPFLIAAGQAGAQTANGKDMLLHQGVKAFNLWFPDTTPEAAMRRGLG
ncbi:shikimate dehydrogenase [Haloferula rosea]|uniref:Shikimate dehydrogenase (NADP(+)) n=1 Tax=Haloferula rosea TaxID=490093 RepID=A0A934VDR2_9BACT|nr:shikimate dehydrogenase [Haloferula rosea]MBK1826534.1 shikimate dehydrogenase [Haloferula rosea]